MQATLCSNQVAERVEGPFLAKHPLGRPGATSQVFTAREEGNGEVALYNRRWHKKCVSMWASSVGSSSSCGSESRFVLVPAERLLTPGTMIALHSTAHNCFVRMKGQHLDRSDVKDAADLPSDWVSEHFTVVDAGHGQIALHNAVQNRFVGNGKSSPHRFVDQLPGDWLYERDGLSDVGVCNVCSLSLASVHLAEAQCEISFGRAKWGDPTP
eukprot:s4600_g4.t1